MELVQEHEGKAKRYAFDSIFFKRFRLCLGIIFPSLICDSTLLLSVLLGLSVGQQLTIFNVGILPSSFMEVLGNKSESEMKSLVVKSFILIIGIAVFNSASKAVSGYLYVHWRNKLTMFLHRNYMRRSTHYFITNELTKTTTSAKTTTTKLDNADQRITQEVDKLCSLSSDIIAKVLISPLVIVYYSLKCFKVTGVTGPLVIYGYFVVGALINKILMSFIVNLIYKKEKREGDLRYKHMKIRTSSESIALNRSEANETHKLNQCFTELMSTQQKIVNMEILLNFSTNFIDYLGSIISYMVISVPIFAGKYNDLTPVKMSAVISKNAFVSMYLINCFSTLLDLSTQLTEISGYCHRIGELIETMQNHEQARIEEEKRKLQFSEDLINVDAKEKDREEEFCCKITNLSYAHVTTGKYLLQELNLVISPKENLIIFGESGIGKSSLFRVLRELWSVTEGHVEFHEHLNHRNRVMFLPQIPVLGSGSLLELVIYPDIKKNLKVDHLDNENVKEKTGEALHDAGLLSLLDELGITNIDGFDLDSIDTDPGWNWEQKLSPGQIQKIQFARLFYHRPCLAFLDEATSSMGIADEEMLYERCKSLGITLVSIGHRDSLKRYHCRYLRIKNNGLWDYGEI